MVRSLAFCLLLLRERSSFQWKSLRFTFTPLTHSNQMRPDKTVAPLRKVYVLFVFFAASGAKHQQSAYQLWEASHTFIFSLFFPVRGGWIPVGRFVVDSIYLSTFAAHCSFECVLSSPLPTSNRSRRPVFSLFSGAKKGSHSVGGGMNLDVGALPGKFILQMSSPWSLWRKWSGTWKIGADGRLFFVGNWAMTPKID